MRVDSWLTETSSLYGPILFSFRAINSYIKHAFPYPTLPLDLEVNNISAHYFMCKSVKLLNMSLMVKNSSNSYERVLLKAVS